MTVSRPLGVTDPRVVNHSEACAGKRGSGEPMAFEKLVSKVDDANDQQARATSHTQSQSAGESIERSGKFPGGRKDGQAAKSDNLDDAAASLVAGVGANAYQEFASEELSKTVKGTASSTITSLVGAIRGAHSAVARHQGQTSPFDGLENPAIGSTLFQRMPVTDDLRLGGVLRSSTHGPAAAEAAASMFDRSDIDPNARFNLTSKIFHDTESWRAAGGDAATRQPIGTSVLRYETHLAPVIQDRHQHGGDDGDNRGIGRPEWPAPLEKSHRSRSYAVSGPALDSTATKLEKMPKRDVGAMDNLSGARANADLSGQLIDAVVRNWNPDGRFIAQSSEASGTFVRFQEALVQSSRSSTPLRVVSIVLSPAELGSVTITVKGNAGGIHIQLGAERADTALIVDGERDMLMNRLHGIGYRVDDVSVVCTGQSSADGNAGSATRGTGDQSQLSASANDSRNSGARSQEREQPSYSSHDRERGEPKRSQEAVPHASGVVGKPGLAIFSSRYV